MSRARTTRVASILAPLVLLLAPTVAHADFRFESFEAHSLTRTGTEETTAGAHPFDATVEFSLNQTIEPLGGFPIPEENPKDITVDLPPGFVGDPTAAATCTTNQLAGPPIQEPVACPVASQVGIVEIRFAMGFQPPDPTAYPVYNMVPERGQVARFGFNPLAGVPVEIVAGVRTDGDYGIRATLKSISEGQPVLQSKLTLWGVPADPVHDAQRGTQWSCLGPIADPANCSGGGAPSSLPLRPFLSNPARCAARDTTTIAAVSWRHPDVVATDHYTATDASTDCDRQAFAPTVSLQPGTQRPDAPAGVNVTLDFPQNANPKGLATPPLKDATVTLPEGMTINPASANGLAACTDAQFGAGSTAPVRCPDAARVGTVTAVTPVLDEPLEGSVYVLSQASDDPASGDMFRIGLVLTNAERGLSFRLPGKIHADPRTGRLQTTFSNNPQLPVSEIALRFKSGPRAPLVTPPDCGTKTTEAVLTSWGGQTATVSDAFDVACAPGLGAFGPVMQAGTQDPTAGSFSPFLLAITKPDAQAALSGLSLTLPTGLLARLKGNVGSQVGTAHVAAGPGADPFWLSGPVYLEGPYGDAPFSLRVVVPAKAGPFDLGDVTVRQKIYVDPIDAHVTVVSDPLPTVVKGVPVRLQRLDVDVDKPGFMINPTSCAPKTIAGTLAAVDGQTAPVTTRFQISDCTGLDLRPKLDLSLSGKGQTRDGGHPAISATLTQPGGGANLKKVRVALPLSLALDPDNSNSDGLCSFVEGSKPNPVCPASSVVGRATAVSPILNEPLSGPVYFVKNERKDPKSGRSIKTTPKLVIPLVGENGVKLTLTGTSSVPDNQHLVTTFDAIPDAPVSSFTLDINGGKKGILVISGEKADICKSTQIADQQIDGQNNKTADADIAIHTPSCPLAVVASSHTASALKVTVGGIGAGKVSVSGKGLAKTTRTIASATTATLAPKLTKANRYRLAHGHDVKVRVTVSFTPKGAKKAKTAHKALTIHAAKQ